MIFFIKPSLFPEFSLQIPGNPSVQIHKPETEIRFDPYFPASTSSSSSCYLPSNMSIGYALTPPHPGPQTTVISCSDNHNHLLSALTTANPVPLWSFMHMTARGIFSIQIGSCYTSAKNFSMVSHYFRMKTNSVARSTIYIFLPWLTLQLLPLSLLQLHWLSSHPLPPLSAHHSLSASTRFGFSSPFSQLTPSHSSKINPRTISIRKPFLTYLSLNTNKNPYSLFIDHIFVVLIIVIISYLCVCFIFKCL